LDSQLHYAIINAFGNEYLNKLMENMYTQNERIRRLSTLIPQRIDESFNEHLLIVEAMLARDPQKAADAMRSHLTTAQNVAFLL
jgi:DNA-binding FadR family transcriptional regulator